MTVMRRVYTRWQQDNRYDSDVCVLVGNKITIEENEKHRNTVTPAPLEMDLDPILIASTIRR